MCAQRWTDHGSRSYWIVACAIMACIGVTAPGASAQSVAASTIHGTVMDETAAPLPGVVVTLTSPALQVTEMVSVTSANGAYRFVDLPAGTYTLRGELEGFSTVVRSDLRLTVGFVARIDLTMSVGALSETVTVSGQAPVVDVTTTSTSVFLTSEVLDAVPRGRGLADVFAMAPGVTTDGRPDVGDSNLAARQDIEAYGSAAQPKMQVEGINIANSGQNSSGVYFTAFPFEEVQIKTSGNDAEVSTPGISMVAVLKSGGNQFHGTFGASFQRPELQANNITDSLRAQGLSNTEPLKYYYDVAADLGGRIIRDRLWFYTAWNKQQRVSGLVGFAANPGPDGTYLTEDDVPADYTNSLRVSTLKLSYQLSQNNKLIAVWQPSVKLQPQNGAGRFRPLEATRDYDNPTSIYKGEIQSMVTPRLLVNVVGGYGGYVADYSAPRAGFMSPDNPSRLDRETGLRTGPHEASEQRPRDRWQADGSISFFPERFLGGRHEMKAGTSLYWEHAGSGRLNHSNGNYVLVYDNVGGRSGHPTEIEIFNSPIVPSSWATVYAAYVKDTWRISERLTANLGLRVERQHSYLPAQSKEASPFFPELYPAGDFPELDVLTWNAVMPRAGLAWNLNPKTVVKGTFGVFVDAIGDEFATDYNRNALSTAVFRWPDLDGNDNYTPGEVNLDLNGPDFISITAASNNILNPQLKQPLTTEATASFERELMENLGVRALYVFKQRRNQYGDVNVLRPYSAYNIPLTRRDPGPDGVLDTPDDGGAVTIYDYDAALRGAEFVGSQRVNSGDVDSWQSIELTLTQRSSGNWSAVASFWAIKNDVWLDAVRESPNAESFPKNETWEWASTVSGSYRMPGDIMLSGFLQAKQGSVGGRTNIFREVDPDGGTPLTQLSTVTLRLEPYGSTRGPALKLVNLRASKRFPFGNKRIDVDFDFFNVFNSGTPTALTYASGPTFAYATNVVPARVARVGARFSF